MSPDQGEEFIPFLMAELRTTKRWVREAKERAELVQAQKPELDAAMAEGCESYDFERIQTIERNILRLGIYEMFYDEEIPYKVAMSEAIRLARKFCTPESSNFVNAVMDRVYKVRNADREE